MTTALSREDQRIAIVGGCGHVGLPLGIALANAGAEVHLVDIDEERRARCARGEMPFRERDGDAQLGQALATGRLHLRARLDVDVDVVIVTVGTPVDEYQNPSLRPFEAVVCDVMGQMRAGQLLVIRSTVFPGVSARVARLAHDKVGIDLDIAYCPERIAEGRAFEELPVLPQIVSGDGPRAVARAVALFRRIVSTTIELPFVEAELAKLFSNAFRYISFAIANQFHMIADGFGADYGRILDAARRDYPRLQGLPMSGFAAGPCLLKDTLQLAAFNLHSFPLGQAAMTINEGLPAFMVHRLRERFPLADMTVGILGLAFKGDSDDPRDSLAYKLKKLLELYARRVIVTDPYVEDPDVVDLDVCLRDSDVVVVGACHAVYRDLVLGKPVIDVFGFLGRKP